MRVAVLQLTSSDDPNANLTDTVSFITQAAAQGARLVMTPEVTNCVSLSRTHQERVLHPERTDPTLSALRAQARKLGIYILIGSLAIKGDDQDPRFRNRSFLIAPSGAIIARYDKIHMFDVTISRNEQYRESAGYRPGTTAVTARVDGTILGLAICYDMRFAHLFRRLAKAGAQIITAPSAFSPTTGAAHWEVLLRARAIECGAFVVAPAQTGTHHTNQGRQRETYGHSMVIDPWGRVLLDMGTAPGVAVIDLDLAQTDQSRKSLPSLMHDGTIFGP